MLIRDRDSRPCSEISPFSESGLSLLKNPSDHRGCSSATAFVRSRNPVTVISKIESRNLDRAPDMGCPTQWVERDGSRRSDGAIDDRCGSGRATFVPVMESADLGKCDDLASGRRLDRAGIRTVFI